MRELTHDINANFMVLRDSFDQLKQQVDENPLPRLMEGAAHVEACLLESKRLLDDLATLAKTGAVQMEPERVQLSDVVKETLFEQEELLKQREIMVYIGDAFPTVSCNRKRVKQVVTNLVRNAAIHGCDSQTPHIKIHCERIEQDGVSFVKMVVHDNGAGIPLAMAEDIFEPGIQGNPREQEGSGMGLAIVRRIAEHHGGSAYVDRDVHDGTAIVITLPLAMRAG
tara:strand:- start:290 stop:964 length:675 start_codon:yes stop_codon:yes gene_type:complete